MTISLQQTDTAAVDGVLAMCSGLTAGISTTSKQATQSGTPGSTATNAAGKQGSTGYSICFETAANEPGITAWPSGNYVVRINITTLRANTTWEDTYICRCDSGGTNQETIGSLTGQAISCGTTGVKTMTVSGNATTAVATDRIYIVCGFKKVGKASGVFQFTPDQLIDTPFTAGGATVATSTQSLMGIG